MAVLDVSVGPGVLASCTRWPLPPLRCAPLPAPLSAVYSGALLAAAGSAAPDGAWDVVFLPRRTLAGDWRVWSWETALPATLSLSRVALLVTGMDTAQAEAVEWMLTQYDVQKGEMTRVGADSGEGNAVTVYVDAQAARARLLAHSGADACSVSNSSKPAVPRWVCHLLPSIRW